MTSWPDHLSCGNQKRFKRDPLKRIGAITRTTFTAQSRLLAARMSFAIELPGGVNDAIPRTSASAR